jgi:phage gpG-like protein
MSKIKGLPKLEAQLGGMPAAIRTNVGKELFRGAVAIQAGAKRRLTANKSVDTGRLRNSIAVDSTPDLLHHRIGTNVKYAKRIEFGFRGTVQIPEHNVRAHTRRGKPVKAHTRSAHTQQVNQAAKPYLFPAFEEERPKIIANVRRATKESVRRSK